MSPRGRHDGPVVILGSANSLFVGQMAGYFHAHGQRVVVVSLQEPGASIPAGVEVVDARPRSLAARAGFKAIRPLAHWVQRRWMEQCLPEFRRRTGKDRPDEWEWAVWDQLEHAWRLSRLALRQRPRCVVGQELAGYGVPAALCRGVPRILHPWGSDVYLTPESWPGAEQLIRFAIRRAELLIPSSVTAAEYLVDRFGVDPQRVLGLSFGIDPRLVATTGTEERATICANWGLNPGRLIVQNCRRFRRQWGSQPALRAFLVLARERPQTHFVLLSGGTDIPEIVEARSHIHAAGLTDRFTVIDRPLSAEEYNQLARVSDVSLSLTSRGDMRSASVLIHAAAGAVLVLSEHPEFRALESQGFRAMFADPGDDRSVLMALRQAVDRVGDSQWRTENQSYILQHENQVRQVQSLLQRVDQLVAEYFAP